MEASNIANGTRKRFRKHNSISMKKFKPSTFTEVITILFITLFLYTGISKLMEYRVFKEQIGASPLLAPVASGIAAALPWVEFLIVLLLVIPRWRLTGLYASLGIMILFTVYIIAMLAFNRRIPCSCGGVIQLLSWNQHIIFNSEFILLGAIGVALEELIKKRKKTLTLIADHKN